MFIYGIYGIILHVMTFMGPLDPIPRLRTYASRLVEEEVAHSSIFPKSKQTQSLSAAENINKT